MAFFQAEHLWVEETADGVATLVLDGPEKVNHLDRAVLEELDQALTRIENEPRFQLCMLRSKKGASFCHGVTGAAFDALQSPQAWDTFAALGQRVCDRLTSLRTPTVALIAGACFAGGLELALACDWRLALDKPATQLAFTEMEWGLMPSWGGVARTVQLAGLERGLQFLLGAKKLSAGAAHRWGLVDDLVDADSDAPPRLIQQPRKRAVSDRPRRNWRQRFLEATAWGRRLTLRGAERVLRRRVPDEMPAPWELLTAIRVLVERGEAACKAQVRTALSRLGASAACRNLLRLQRLSEMARARAVAEPRPKNIGILGATPLALHLAAQLAVKGCRVVLRETDEMMLGMATLQLIKTLQDEVTRGTMSQHQFTSNVNHIRPTISWKDFGELELVIDATHGAIEAEQRLVRELEEHVSVEAVIATVQPWRALAAWQPWLRNPGRALGMHFPAPVGRVPLVEVLASPATAAPAVRCIQGIARMLGKTALIVQETTGGLIQRVLGAEFAEALSLLEDGHLPERIDPAMLRFGMVYGPLEHLDLLGLDEFVLSARRLEAVLGDAAAEHSVAQYMIEHRWLGLKTGLGFYQHAGSAKRMNRALRRWLQRSFAARLTPLSAAQQTESIQQRLVGRMVNEAFRCLDEDVVPSTEDLDLALTLVGWAPHRGGPCRYAEQTGYSAMVQRLEGLAQQYGERFAPCPALQRLATS